MWKKYLYPPFLFVMLIVSTPTLADLLVDNPIKAADFPTLIEELAHALLIVGLPLAAFAILLVGFKLAVSASSGDQKGVQEAKKALVWVLIGSAIVIGAAVLAQAVINTTNSIFS